MLNKLLLFNIATIFVHVLKSKQSRNLNKLVRDLFSSHFLCLKRKYKIPKSAFEAKTVLINLNKN